MVDSDHDGQTAFRVFIKRATRDQSQPLTRQNRAVCQDRQWTRRRDS